MPDFSRPLQIILYEPEIPPNTGNLIRLCANTGIGLHLVEPLGFSLEEKALRRAGLDYHETARVRVHASLSACLSHLAAEHAQSANNENFRVFAVTTKGSVPYHQPRYRAGDVLLFGPESRGLPDDVLEAPSMTERVRIPMQAGSRSLNLSNAVAIIAYEALRQLDFPALA